MGIFSSDAVARPGRNLCSLPYGPAAAPYFFVPVKVPVSVLLFHVPLKTGGVLEVSNVPVQVAEPAAPLYVVPETRLPDTVEVPPLLSVAVPETPPFEAIVTVQVPELLPLYVPA